MTKTLEVVLKGPHAALGEVLASDVARLLVGAERTVGRAAEIVIGRQPKRSGRRVAVVEAATRFRLKALTSGSVTAVLELPAVGHTDDGGLDLGDATLGELAVEEALAVIDGRSDDPYVADALAGLGDELSLGDRYDEIEFRFRQGLRPQIARLDQKNRDRLRRLARRSSGPAAVAHLVGTLVEADFENRTARLRTATQDAVKVSFEEDLAEDIRSALRRQADLEGIVHYDEAAARAVSVVLRGITRTEQMFIDQYDLDFWSSPTIGELADAQQIEPVADIELLRDRLQPDDDEIDAFFAAIKG